MWHNLCKYVHTVYTCIYSKISDCLYLSPPNNTTKHCKIYINEPCQYVVWCHCFCLQVWFSMVKLLTFNLRRKNNIWKSKVNCNKFGMALFQGQIPSSVYIKTKLKSLALISHTLKPSRSVCGHLRSAWGSAGIQIYSIHENHSLAECLTNTNSACITNTYKQTVHAEHML